MRTSDLLRISGRQVWRQYRKNIGVATAIILGTAGLMVIITMGRSIEENVSGDLEIIGNASRIRVIFKPYSSSRSLINPREFKPETIDAIKKIPGIDSVSGIVLRKQYVRIIYQDKVHYFRMIGIDDSIWKVHGSSASSGVLLTREDIRHRRAACVLGQRAAQILFDDQNAIGQFITINKNVFQVVGILDSVSMPDKFKDAFLPITTAKDRFDMVSPVAWLYIRCHSWDDVERVAKAIPAIVKIYQPSDEIEILLFNEILKKVKTISFGVKIFVQLALLSTLLLGGVGIWNIMMMAVRSRTREIGLKKAIGAEDHDILFQFLTESLMLCLSATIVGFFLGWAGVRLTASILDSSPPQNLFWLSTAIGFIFSLILGIIAGLAPAIKASKMEVVSALRYE